MKIVRYLADEEEGVSFGRLREDKIYKITGNIFERGELIRIAGEEYNPGDVRLLPPVNPPNIIAVGLNYREHARETGIDIPREPLIFSKLTSSLIGPEDKIVLPAEAPNRVDYEAELGVVISRPARDIPPEKAEDYILGYTCVNDVTARDCQQSDGQWTRAKSFDSFCPVGPWIETELDPENCAISCEVNGELRQDSTTGDMIFSVYEIVSYLSQNMTLLSGTLITTGTPSGVGMGYNPAKYLKEDDSIRVKIQGLGTLENRVVKRA